MSQNVGEAAKYVTRWLVGNCTPEANTFGFPKLYGSEAVCISQDKHAHNVGLSLISLCGVAALSIACGHAAGNSNWLRDTIYVLLVIGCYNLKSLTQLSFAAHSGYLLPICLVSSSLLLLQQWRNREVTYGADDTGKDHFLRPMLFPCRTKHARIFPTRHMFSYSYLFVGIPIGWKGSIDSMLSTSSETAGTWFTVHADDYLSRGSHIGGLQGKLKDYLMSQGLDQSLYPYAYLITAPRFLGFSFNPVSFWYLYDEHKGLTAMILEVNNTFDERRMYFMQKKSQKDGARDAFTSQWRKDFHVSPFNDRDGSYSLKTKNVIETLRIDNNIVLRSEEGKAKVVARVFSTSVGIDPARLSRIQQLYFIARWWWVGFMTNPRILREARTLWAKKLRVFYRPEVLIESIGRNETIDEISLETIFRACLQNLVNRSSSLNLRYKSAAGMDRGKVTLIEPETRTSTSRSDVELQVLTPAFYSYLVRGMSLREVFDQYCFNPGPNEAMLYTSSPESLLRLLDHSILDDPMSIQTGKENFVSLLRAGGLLDAASRGFIPRSPTDKRTTRLSEFDCYARKLFSAAVYDVYLDTVLWILIADRLAFGLVTLLRAYILVLWTIVLVLTASAANSIIGPFEMTRRSMLVGLGLISLHLLARLTIKASPIIAH